MRRTLTVAATAALLVTLGSPALAQSQLAGPGGLAPGDGAAGGQPPTGAATPDQHGHYPDATSVAGAGVASPSAGFDATVPASDLPADWSLLGPPGGDVADVAVSPADPDLVLAGLAPNGSIGGTLYRSVDGGDNWSPVPALSGISVLNIEYAPDGRAYLGTQRGVWTSDDGGQSWTERDLGIGANQFVAEVALEPTDPARVWVGVGDAIGSNPINLMRSTDGGVTWQDRTPPLPQPLGGTAVAFDPTDPDTVIAGFGSGLGGGSVWVSTDGGDTWQNRSAGLPANPMRALEYDGDRLLLAGGQLFGSQHVGLYASHDLGVSWQALHDETWPIPVVHDLVVNPADADTILVATDGSGVHRSVDGGESWQIGVGGSEALAGRSLRFSPGSSSELFLGTSSLAVFRSTDGGDSFGQSAEGISELTLTSIATNPLDAAEIAVSFEGQNDGGVLSSTDAGANWTMEGLPPTRYSAVGFAPDGTLHAISSGPTTIAQEGLYRRGPSGDWTLLGPDQGPLFESDLNNLRFSTNDPDLILLGGRDFGVAGNEATIWRSDDDGQTWTKVYEVGANDLVHDIEIVEDGTDQHQLAVWSSISGDNLGGVLRSDDGGVTWAPVTDGVPADFFREPRMCASPVAAETLYLSVWRSLSEGAVFRTDDGGLSWQPTGWTGPRVRDLACDPVDDQVLYAGLVLADDVVVRSGDQGISFESFSEGLGTVNPSQLAFAGESRLLLASGQGSYVTQLREVEDPPDPDPVVCDETIIGVHAGPLTVSEGTTCLAAGAHVLGEVNVLGGAGLISSAAVVQGPVSAVGATVVDLSFTQVTGPVLVSGATHTVSLFGNQVTGSVSLVGNGTQAAAVVAGNTIIGALSCFDNDPAPTDLGLPNTATAGKLGQCVPL